MMMPEPLVLKCSVASDDDPALHTGEPYEEIDLAGSSRLGVRGLQRLNGERVRSAVFTGCESLDDEAVRVIASWPRLEKLGLAGCDRITDDGVTALARCKLLQALDLAWCYAVGDGALGYLEALPLRWLDLTSCNLSGKGVETLARFRFLEQLMLPMFAPIADEAIEQFATTGAPLRTLVFGGDVTPKALRALAKVRTLKEIGLGGRDRSFPDEAFAAATPPGVRLTFV